MKIKEFLLIVFLLSGIVLSSCKKGEEESKVVTDDPRIRSMVISALPNATFVVNDMTGLIFNYDSLSYGTPINNLNPEFGGYGGALSFQYKLGENGEWKEFSNNALDFSTALPVFFKSIAPDADYTKEYRIDVRVHKYDVEAFTWTEKANALSVQGTVVSQKAVFYNQKYYFFYRNDLGKSYVITSGDGDDWTNGDEINIENPDWATLTSMHQSHKLAVQVAEELYVCDLSTGTPSFTQSNVALPEGTILQAPLFTLRNNFWIIAKEADLAFLYSLAEGAEEYEKRTSLPSRTPVEQITTFVSPSGSTTLGYIFGGKNTIGNGSVWGVDVSGNIMELTSNQYALPFLNYPMPLFFGNKLYLAGGIASYTGRTPSEESYTNRYIDLFYGSPNSGTGWSQDTHKFLPDEIKFAKGSLFEYKRNNIILIGGEIPIGENESKFSPSVWKGQLNQEILDDPNPKILDNLILKGN